MKNTLYIQIDNNSLPQGLGEEVEELVCTCINDFCSIVGDALVSDLKDEDGKPFYRLINPVGQLLMDFKTANEEAFNNVIAKWHDYLGELLHKGTLESDMTIKFPQTYIDWLLQNDNPYYESVGKELQKKNGEIAIPSEDVIDDVMASLTYKISHTLQDKKGNISFVVFSNPIFRNSSYVVKRVKLDGVEFLRYESWCEIIKKKEKDINYSTTSTNGVPAQSKQTYKEFSVNGVSFKMIYVDSNISNLSPFFISETLVTQELWESIMGNNPSYYKGLHRPVEVSYWKIGEFLEELNKLLGKQFRLPTKEEWLFAAKGGTKSCNYIYSGGNRIDLVAWYEGNSPNHNYGTHDVKTRKPNELGIYDMSGNLEEWCVAEKIVPNSPDTLYTICGGGWHSPASICRKDSIHCFFGGTLPYGIRLVFTE